MSDADKYQEIFDYLSAPAAPSEAHGVLAFGRKDLLVAHKIVDVSRAGFAKYVIITGGKGKNSGNLQIPEAQYLGEGVAEISENEHTPVPPVYLETRAENGAQNVQYSLQIMREYRLPYKDAITALAHATSLRRLGAMAEFESAKIDDPIANVYRIPTDYNFDPTNPVDQEEALGELRRLIEWPQRVNEMGQAEPWLGPQEVPENLVDFYSDQSQG